MLLPVLSCCLISACALKMNLVDLVPEADETVAELPDEFTGSGDAGSYQPLEWWKSFADPVLDRIIRHGALEVELRHWPEAGGPGRTARGRAAHRQAPAFPLLQTLRWIITRTDHTHKCRIAGATGLKSVWVRRIPATSASSCPTGLTSALPIR